MKNPADSIAIAHRVLPQEDFDRTAQILLNLLNDAQRKFPGAKRYLHLEIAGQLDSLGRFTYDMLELQSKFMVEFLM